MPWILLGILGLGIAIVAVTGKPEAPVSLLGKMITVHGMAQKRYVVNFIQPDGRLLIQELDKPFRQLAIEPGQVREVLGDDPRKQV